MGDVAVYVVFGRDTGSGGTGRGTDTELPYWAGLLPSRAGRGRGARIAVAYREIGPRWCAMALPILPSFTDVEVHHVHATQLE